MESGMRLEDLIAAVRREAERLHEALGLPIDYAYQQAIVAVFRAEAERPDLTPIQERIVKTLWVLCPDPENGAPVETETIQQRVGGLNTTWQTWYHMNEPREAGYVYKPGGKYSHGWKPRRRVA